MSPGIVIIPVPPLTHEQASRGRDACAGMACRARLPGDDPRAITRRKRCRSRIDRDDEHAGKLSRTALTASSTSSSIVLASVRRSSALRA